MDSHPTVPQIPARNWRTTLIRTPLGWVISLALAALGVYLIMAHTGHVLAALPYLFLLACPLIHLFMHGGHGHNHHKNK